MCLKRWYTLGVAGLLSLAGVGSANIGGTASMLSPVPEGEPVATAPPPTPTPELQTFTAGGHVLGFSPRYLLTASGSHALKVEFLNTRGVTPQSDMPAANQVGSAQRAPDSPRPPGEGLGVRGSDRSGQDQKAPPLTQVRYPNLWEGIDLSYHAVPGGIAESLYRLQPGANINQVRLRYNRPLSLDADGGLSIRFDTGTLTESAPIAWQEVDGQRQAVSVAFVQHNERELGFALGAYDVTQPLWIDPALTWNTFLGGSGDESIGAAAYFPVIQIVIQGIVVDNSGSVYVSGTSSATWGNPVRAFTPGTISTLGLGDDVFVAKLDNNGNLLWNTFLGNKNGDEGAAIAVDNSGNVYVTGGSFDTWGNPVQVGGNYSAAFVTKLNANGTLLWNTFMGSKSSNGYGIAVDSSGNVYVTGGSSDTWGAPVRAYSGYYSEAFVAKLNSNGSLLWNTFLGSNNIDMGYGIAVDSRGYVYVNGRSDGSWDTPIRAYIGGPDAFVAKLDGSGNKLWNTFLGTYGNDFGISIKVDTSGQIYVTGFSEGTWGSPVRPHGGDSGYAYSDAFVAKLNNQGTLLWNTFLGGNSYDKGSDLVLDGSGNVYVTGYSSATWESPLHAYSGSDDAFVAQLNNNGTLLWNTFLGGGSNDEGNAIAVDSSGNVYVTGSSQTTWGDPIRAFSGGWEVFVAKLGTLTQLNLSGQVYLSGTNIPVCAMVLANGKSQFSCDGQGNFALTAVPLDSQQEVTVYSWAEGFVPYKQVFAPDSASEHLDVAMTVSPCQGPSGGSTTQHSSLPKASLSGKVFLAGTTIPVCAMVLANGKSQFSCGGDGHYVLDDVPLDGNGQVTLYTWAEGFFPYKAVLAPFSIVETRDVPMTVASCPH